MTNIAELRREAYKLWGIGNQTVIFDFPEIQRNSPNDFRFRLDFGEDKASWPRIYAIAENPQTPPNVRVILPIVMMRRYSTFAMETKVWYDMPLRVHEQIIRIFNEARLTRPLPMWRRVLNCFVPRQFRKSDEVLVGNYTYCLTKYNEEIMVSAY